MICWVDASAGVAGDMLLGALLDAGADLARVQAAVDAVLPGSTRLRVSPTNRAGLRAAKLDVDVLVDNPPHRHWSDIRASIEGAGLPEPIRQQSLSVFLRLARAEAQVHGQPVDQVHFHEVGAIDSVADIVGACAALHDLDVRTVIVGPVAVGSGRMRAAHGDLPIPGPAVTELLRGWPITTGGSGELATPTGAALITALGRPGELPRMTLRGNGTGAGTRDDPGRANVTRVLLGEARTDAGTAAVLLEANVDDLDPRVWPTVLTALLRAGAADAWLTPITMKKGRPAQLLSVLADPGIATGLRMIMLTHTSTFGVRQSDTVKFPAARGWIDIDLDGDPVPVKIAHADGEILRATPEFDDAAALAGRRDEPVLAVLDRARAAAANAGLRPGAPVPAGLRPTQEPLENRTRSDP